MTAAKKSTQAKVDEGKPETDTLSGLVVTGAAIQVAVGNQVLQFSEGDLLPSGIDSESVKRLTDRGLIGKPDSK